MLKEYGTEVLGDLINDQQQLHGVVMVVDQIAQLAGRVLRVPAAVASNDWCATSRDAALALPKPEAFRRRSGRRRQAVVVSGSRNCNSASSPTRAL